MRWIALIALCLAAPSWAEIVVPTRTIPARSLIGADDLALQDKIIPGALTSVDLAIGMEARVTLYAGRPIQPGDLSLPAVVERNQIVPLIYQNAGLTISTEGRALDRAAPGEWLRVMNISSRATVMAIVGADGAAYVTQ